MLLFLLLLLLLVVVGCCRVGCGWLCLITYLKEAGLCVCVRSGSFFFRFGQTVWMNSIIITVNNIHYLHVGDS